MPVQTQEARIILAIEAIRTSNRKLSRRNATKIYNVPESSLRLRMNGVTSRSDIQPNCLKLTKLEEETIVRHVFDRDSRGFSPRLANVEDIANYLLEAHRGKHVRKL
jgi:helix-turn-helix, Psq domain